MNTICAILKGILIGIASIIPGVSGGTIAVSMGVYDQIIYAVSHLHKDWKNSLKILFPYGIGVCLAVTFFSFAASFLFTRYPGPTTLTFLGLILGGIPSIWKQIPSPRISRSHVLTFLLTFLIISGLAIWDASAPEIATSQTGFHPSLLFLFLTGILGAATLVIPGVSGTMLLMMLGCYQPLLTSINHFISSILNCDLNGMLQECQILIPFGIGILSGTFLCAHLMEFLFSRFKALTHCAILGLIVSSPIAILVTLSLDSLPVSHLISGFLLFFLGFFLAKELDQEHTS